MDGQSYISDSNTFITKVKIRFCQVESFKIETLEGFKSRSLLKNRNQL